MPPVKPESTHTKADGKLARSWLTELWIQITNNTTKRISQRSVAVKLERKESFLYTYEKVIKQL